MAIQLTQVHPATTTVSVDESRLKAIRDIAGHIIWLHVLGRKVFACANPGKAIDRSDDLAERFDQSLKTTDPAIATAIDVSGRDVSSGVRNGIFRKAKALSFDEAEAIILGHEPDEHYAEILSLQTAQFQACRGTTEEIEARKGEGWGKDHLHQTAVADSDSWRRLIAILQSLTDLRNSIEQALAARHLDPEHLASLKGKAECFQDSWLVAFQVAATKSEPTHSTILTQLRSPRWWSVAPELC